MPCQWRAEGIDVPLLDGVAFVDPKNSIVDIVQAIGRAIRRPDSSQKTTGYVIVPIYLTNPLVVGLQEAQARRESDHQEADIFADAIDEGTGLTGLDRELNRAFRPVVEVLRNLRSMDTALTETITKLTTARGARTPSQPDRKVGILSSLDVSTASEAEASIHLEVLTAQMPGAPAHGDSSGAELGHTQLALLAIHNAVQLTVINQVLDKTVSDWWQTRGVLETFLNSNHGAYPSRTHGTKTADRLTVWVSMQRGAYESGRLDPEQIKSLEGLPGWQWSHHDAAWERNLSALTDFLSEHDASYPSTTSKDENERSLGSWVQVQRSSYLRKELLPERTAALEALPSWRWQVHAESWHQNFEALKGYLATHEDSYPKQNSTDPKVANLGKWLSKQRATHAKEKLSTERTAALESLPGWDWSGVEAAWRAKFGELSEHLTSHDNTYPSTRADEQSAADLAKWVTTQRLRYKDEKLPRSWQLALEGLPGWSWDPLADAWAQYFDSLTKFLRSSGGTYPSRDSKNSDKKALTGWVHTQRSVYSAGNMPAERAKMLEALPGWQWALRDVDALWSRNLERLKTFYAENSGANPDVKAVDPNEASLAQWVRNQRSRKESLSPERMAALEALPDWKWRLR